MTSAPRLSRRHPCIAKSYWFESTDFASVISVPVWSLLFVYALTTHGYFVIEMHNFNLWSVFFHYNGVIMSEIASQITSLAIVYSTVYSRHRSKETSKRRVTGLLRGIHRWPVNSPHKGPIMRKMFPFDDVIIWWCSGRPLYPQDLWTILRICQKQIEIKQYDLNFLLRPFLDIGWNFAAPRCIKCTWNAISHHTLKACGSSSCNKNVFCDWPCYSSRVDKHDDVIKWKHFPRYWPSVRGIHQWPVNFLHKCQWRGALMFSLICAWTIGWVNNRGAGDLRRNHVHYDVTVMVLPVRYQPRDSTQTTGYLGIRIAVIVLMLTRF